MLAKEEDATEPLPAKKKSRFAIPTVEEFAGDLSLWFDALHARAQPGLTRLERGVTGDGLIANPLVSFKRLPMSEVWEEIRGEVERKDSKDHVALMLAASADRCCVLAKEFKQPELGQIAKLFARHMNVDKQSEFLKQKKDVVRMSLGTPNRVLKLLQASATEDTTLRKFHYLVIDMKEDMKKFTLLTIPQISQDLFQLCREFVLQTDTPITILFAE